MGSAPTVVLISLPATTLSKCQNYKKQFPKTPAFHHSSSAFAGKKWWTKLSNSTAVCSVKAGTHRQHGTACQGKRFYYTNKIILWWRLLWWDQDKNQFWSHWNKIQYLEINWFYNGETSRGIFWQHATCCWMLLHDESCHCFPRDVWAKFWLLS